MAVFQRIDINLVASLYLGVVLFLAFHRLDRKDPFNRLFFKACALILSMSLFEAATCLLNHNPAGWAAALSTVLHMFLFAVAPLMTYYWYLLTDTLTRHGDVREIHSRWRSMFPVFVVFVLTALSPFFGFVFSIDAAGVYHRGPLFVIDLLVTYAYLMLGFLLTLIRRRDLTGQDGLFLVLICLMPLIGGLIQGLFYGALLMWASSALALTIMYLYLQERMMQTDWQTGAWTRHSFEYNLSQRLRQGVGKPFGIAYVDIDNLKQINDRYGHREGDETIKATVRVIKSALRKGDAVARLGGDEFAVFLELDNSDALEKVIQRIHQAVERHNDTSGKAYRLSLSIGAELFREGADASVEEIISQADRKMYERKREKKREEAGAETGAPTVP